MTLATFTHIWYVVSGGDDPTTTTKTYGVKSQTLGHSFYNVNILYTTLLVADTLTIWFIGMQFICKYHQLPSNNPVPIIIKAYFYIENNHEMFTSI